MSRGAVVRSRNGVRAAATGKAQSPTDDSCVRRTISDNDNAERRRSRASRSKDWRNSWYDGAVRLIYTLVKWV